jgi:signal transduction histidine kinase
MGGARPDLARSTAAATAGMAAAAEVLEGHLEHVLEERAGELGAEQRRFLDVAARHCRRLAKLAADLRTVALVESGAMQPDASRCDLAALARGAIASAWPLAHVQRKQVVLIGADAAWAFVDAGHVERALQDLVSFAVERSPREGLIEVVVHAAGVSVAYTAEALPDGDHVALALAEAVGRLHGGGLAAAWEAGRALLSLVVVPDDPVALTFEAA